MLPITGYVDRWSARPGDTVTARISVQGGGPYRARIARVTCADPNPAGPGYREDPVPWDLEGEHPGEQQDIHLGSWADIPDVALPGGPVALAATLWPTRLAAGEQAVLGWAGAGGSLTLGIGPQGAVCRLRTPAGSWELRTHVPLTERAWHDVACVLDPASGRLRLGQAPHRPRLDRTEAAQCELPIQGELAGPGAVTLAAQRSGDFDSERSGDFKSERSDDFKSERTALPAPHGTPTAARSRVTAHYNGKLERPRLLAGTPTLTDLLAAQRSGPAAHTPGATTPGATTPGATTLAGTTLAAWDLARAMRTDTVEDTGPHARHGTLVNLPTRAMTGSNWRGTVHRWTEDPAQYGAIHFHDDDLGDAGWHPSLSFVVPDAWTSGVYALHLECAAGRDNIVFHVRAKVPGSQAKVAFLAPTFSYTVYSQFQKAGRQALITERSLAWGALAQAPDGHPEYGVSPYNLHSDGSGVVMSTTRRPLIDKRVNQIHLVDPSEGGSGLYWIGADSYVTDLLTRKGIAYEVITDHDVHAEGAALLKNYTVVLTGQHPEYHTDQTMDALASYLDQGGRFMYLGGNGFYWKVVPHGEGPWSLELRRAEGGIRLWETLPGEGYHAQDGSYGGLWRRLGRPPQALVGVGFSTQGDYKGYPYRFLDGILDPRVAFMREGMAEHAVPGGVLGERGLMGGGAAGHELDRADPLLGTPHHAIVVGRAVVEDPSYQPVNEERRDHTWPGTREELIRSDLTFFETPNGGAVFSVGSMNFLGALPVDGYASVAATLVTNVVRRFADPAPFPPPA